MNPPTFMENITRDGVEYRPLLSGELREPGDTFFCRMLDNMRPELPQFIGTPQDAHPEPLEQSYRPVVRDIIRENMGVVT